MLSEVETSDFWKSVLDRHDQGILSSTCTGALKMVDDRQVYIISLDFQLTQQLPYNLLIRVLDHVEIRADGKLSVSFLVGIRMDR